MSSDNWNVEKNKYISNIKNGVKYIEKDFINTDKIENKKSSVDKKGRIIVDCIIMVYTCEKQFTKYDDASKKNAKGY